MDPAVLPATSRRSRRSRAGEPAWEIAVLFPPQGGWTETEYLALLAIEVVSDDEEDRQRDLETKRAEYAEAGIAEYWIVDPREHTILVLALDGSTYRVHGEFARGAMATSLLLSGFTVSVDAVFAAGDSER